MTGFTWREGKRLNENLVIVFGTNSIQDMLSAERDGRNKPNFFFDVKTNQTWVQLQERPPRTPDGQSAVVFLNRFSLTGGRGVISILVEG
jgi:hypothetical protein